MTSGQAPAFYNDLLLSLAEARRLIESGAIDRHSAAHAPSVATIDTDGAPAQRVMIVRAVDWSNRTVRFHTDLRSTKIAQADGKPVSILIYSAADKIQLRLSGTAAVEHHSPNADAAWHASTLFARRCYMAENAPGTHNATPTSGLPDHIEGQQPTEEDIASAYSNFAILLVNFDCIEWLYLANQGHRRARWHWIKDHWEGGWLIP